MKSGIQGRSCLGLVSIYCAYEIYPFSLNTSLSDTLGFSLSKSIRFPGSKNYLQPYLACKWKRSPESCVSFLCRSCLFFTSSVWNLEKLVDILNIFIVISIAYAFWICFLSILLLFLYVEKVEWLIVVAPICKYSCNWMNGP